MSDSLATRSAADRNLLFGILALQMDFVSRAAFQTFADGHACDVVLDQLRAAPVVA